MSIQIGTDIKKYASIEEKKLDLESGLLGKIFGGSTNAPSNIAGLTIFLLLTVSLFGTVYPAEKLTAPELWKITTPIITMILGYLFGKKN